jgi:hypothetical protein
MPGYLGLSRSIRCAIATMTLTGLAAMGLVDSQVDAFFEKRNSRTWKGALMA